MATDPLQILESIVEAGQAEGEIAEILRARESVLSRFGRMFDPVNVDTMSADDFKSFLRFENNKHWKSIHRQQASITADMPALRNALRLLLDESQPIGERLDRLIRPEAANLIRGLDQAVITPILLVVYPNRYGVWNTISEAAMRQLGLWPSSERGSSFGEQYEIVNQVLNETAATLEIDLWTLDALWWAVEERTDAVGAPDRRYWLFLANPTLWDLEANLRELVVGDEGDWSVTRFGDEMQSGDGVVLWSAGESAGIYAIGQLSSDVFERPYEGFM